MKTWGPVRFYKESRKFMQGHYRPAWKFYLFLPRTAFRFYVLCPLEEKRRTREFRKQVQEILV